MTTNNKNECETNLCSYDTATRTQFFHGMLLTHEQLTSEQSYHREALKRLNRYLYGAGIICGLEVQSTGLCVTVNPGAALDCCGNFIEVCKCVKLDLSKDCEKRFGSDCKPQPAQDDQKLTKYLVLRYDEKGSDPEPVLTPETDCKSSTDKPTCTNSKVREGFCIELSDDCPCPDPAPDQLGLLGSLTPSYGTDPAMPTPARPEEPAGGAAGGTAGGSSPQVPGTESPGSPRTAGEKECIHLPLSCPDCRCLDSAVGLAKLTIDCKNRTVEFDDCTCRQYVMSPRQLRWLMSRFRQEFVTADVKKAQEQIGHRPMANLIGGLAAAEKWGKQINALENPQAAKAEGKTAETAAKTEETTVAKAEETTVEKKKPGAQPKTKEEK